MTISGNNILISSSYNELNADFSKNSTFFENVLPIVDQQYFAKEFYNFYKTDYIYSKNKKVWYSFQENNIMVEWDDVPLHLNNEVTDLLQRILDAKYKAISKYIHYKEFSKRVEKYKKLYMKTRKMIGSTTFVDGIIKKMKGYYSDNDIEKKVDCNYDLLAFKNTVYDLNLKKFRNIERSDYICKHINYEMRFKSNDKIRNEIIKFFRDVMPTEEMKDFLIKTLAISLFGNRFEKFYIFVGQGGNGKGVLFSLLESAIGQYVKCATSQFLTTKFKGGSANSTLYECMNKRIIFVNEPEKNDGDKNLKFNQEFVLKITSADTISCRQLYNGNTDFKAQFSTFVQCNEMPKIDKVNDAISRRFVCIEFPFQFKSNPDKKDKYQKQADHNIKKLFENNVEYHIEFILLLIQYLNVSKFPTIPNQVKKTSEEYFNENNHTLKFMNEYFDRTESVRDKVESKELYDMFREKSEHYLSSIQFHKAMKQNKFIRKKMSRWYYTNIKEKYEEDLEEYE